MIRIVQNRTEINHAVKGAGSGPKPASPNVTGR